MSQPPSDTSNAEQIRYWNDTGGARWLAVHEGHSRQLAPLGLAALERAAIAAGSRVLDIGCGPGDSTFEIGKRVGPEGSVVGVDVSLPLLTRALQRAFELGAGNVSFTLADAQTAELPRQGFDAMFSRFGVMFFAEPEAAFKNLSRALRPGGRLTFICWRDISENPLMRVPAKAVAPLIAVPDPVPNAPGPFAFADSDRVRGILERAGLTEVAIEKHDRVLSVGASGLDGAAKLLTQMGPASRALANAGEALVTAAVAAVREALEPFNTSEGVQMPSATWVVTARAPG